MSYAQADALVSTQWLADHLDAPDVRVVDASWFLPTMNRNGRAEYEVAHIPGAVYFDIDEISDRTNPLPHMIPSAELFSSKVRDLGLGDGNHIVVYDRRGGASAAARVWWMFRLYGNRHVSVLDGGFGKWTSEGRPTEDAPPLPRRRHFTPRMDSRLVRTVDDVATNLQTGAEQIVDARSAGRFRGTDPEPRPAARGGRIPGSLNLPYDLLLNPQTQTFLPPARIRTLFAEAGIDLDRPVTASCGSGVTACVVAFAGYLIGKDDIAVYDGSWSEWGDRTDLPVQTG